MAAIGDATKARRGLPWGETAIADYHDALAETIRDPTQAPQRDFVYTKCSAASLSTWREPQRTPPPANTTWPWQWTRSGIARAIPWSHQGGDAERRLRVCHGVVSNDSG